VGRTTTRSKRVSVVLEPEGPVVGIDVACAIVSQDNPLENEA
jgi:hypothetical protein